MCTMACRSPVEFPYADHFIEFEIPPLSLAEGSFGNLEWEIEFGWHVATTLKHVITPIFGQHTDDEALAPSTDLLTVAPTPSQPVDRVT